MGDANDIEEVVVVVVVVVVVDKERERERERERGRSLQPSSRWSYFFKTM